MAMLGNVILACVCASLSSLAAAQVYKWVDERGVTHYGQRPPDKQPAAQMQGAPPPRAAASATTAAPAAPRPSVPGGASSDAAAFATCKSRACASVRRVDPDCRTSLCTEALALPDECSTIACQGRRAELEKRVAQRELSARARAARDEATLRGAARDPVRDAKAQAEAQRTARAIARCKESRGINCDDPRVAAQWARQDRAPTEAERREVQAARRTRELCSRAPQALGCP